MNAKYWQRGETLDYTHSEAVESGAVVSLGTRIGIAGTDIAANEQGQVHVEGVFELAKDTSVEITLGAAVYYDAAGDVITTASSGNVPAGYAVQAAAQTSTTVLVKLLG